ARRRRLARQREDEREAEGDADDTEGADEHWGVGAWGLGGLTAWGFADRRLNSSPQALKPSFFGDLRGAGHAQHFLRVFVARRRPPLPFLVAPWFHDILVEEHDEEAESENDRHRVVQAECHVHLAARCGAMLVNAGALLASFMMKRGRNMTINTGVSVCD